MIRTALNILWLICGGLLSALFWWLVGALMAISIIGLPWARACFVIGQFSLWPFGRDAVSRELITGQADIGTGTAGLIGNIIWFVVAGVWLAIGHLTLALSCFITIIGIPFGMQHLKLAGIAVAPIGKTIIPVH